MSDLDLPTFAPPPMSAALEGELGDLRAVSPRRPRRQVVTLALASLAYGAIVLAITHTRRDGDVMPKTWLVGAAIAWTFGFLVPIYLAMVPRTGSVLPRWNLAALSAVITAVAFVALGLVINPTSVHSDSYGAARFLHGHGCLEVGLATAIVPVVLGAIFMRGAMPVQSRWIAAAIGAGGGGLGGLVLHFHCHVTDKLHLGVIHGGVVVISALLAALLVPRVTDA